MKRLMIVGIDPGTTAGYAAFDIKGNFIASKSSKELDFDTVISELSGLGTAIIIATDKAKVPSFVSSAATQLGAKVFSPEQDLLVAEKRQITSSISHNNAHEMDSIAAALFALKKYERLFHRIDKFIEDQQRPDLADALRELVVKKEISIRTAFVFLTTPAREETKAVKHVEERKLRAEDYWKLYDALVNAENERALLQRQNRKLLNLARRLKRKTNELRSAVKPETRIIKPTAEIEQSKLKISELQQKLEQTLTRQKRLQHVILNQKKYVIAKRMNNLGYDEYKRVSRVLGFQENDIVFVYDINSHSDRAIDALKDKVTLAVSVLPAHPKVADKLPFPVLSAASVSHTQDEYFAFLNAKELEKARSDKDIMRKLIKDYQESRKQ